MLVLRGERDTAGICGPADAIICLCSGQQPHYSTDQGLGRLPGQLQAPRTAQHESWLTVPPEITLCWANGGLSNDLAALALCTLHCATSQTFVKNDRELDITDFEDELAVLR